MKKMLAILLLVSAVVGMTMPAMAGTEAKSHSDAVNNADIDVALDASNYASHTVAVSLDDATQSNGIGTNVAASGSNTNAALAAFDADAKARYAKSGDAVSGDSGSGSASAGADATSGDGESGMQHPAMLTTQPWLLLTRTLQMQAAIP